MVGRGGETIVIGGMCVRGDVSMDEGHLMRMRPFVRRSHRHVRVGVWRRDESKQQGQHRDASHDSSTHGGAIVDGFSGRCQAACHNRVMNSLTRTNVVALTLAVFIATASLALAHEVTYNGTVVALKTSSYAQPNGGTRQVQELEVTVVDPKTKRPSNRVFTISDKTRLLRAGKPVATAQVSARKDEKVAVIVDHDEPGDEAIEIRFEAAQ